MSDTDRPPQDQEGDCNGGFRITRHVFSRRRPGASGGKARL
jgi:hypothetical protein